MEDVELSWMRAGIFLAFALTIAGCGGKESVAPLAAPQTASPFQLPAGAHRDTRGRVVDAYGRILSWDGAAQEWLAISKGGAVPARISPEEAQAQKLVSSNYDCDATASKDRKTQSNRNTMDSCGSGDLGTVTAPIPTTVTNMFDNGDGTFSDQNENQWTYCAGCTSPDNGSGSTHGEWLQQIAYVQATSTSYASVAFVDGFEDLSMGPYVMASGNPPKAYKEYPSNAYIYFNVNHFWNQHLACYLASSQSQFLDAIAQDLNGHLMSGAQGLFNSYTFPFSDPKGTFMITYRVWHFPIIGDYLVGTAFIFGKPNC